MKRTICLAGILALTTPCIGAARAGVPSDDTRDNPVPCIAKDTTNLTPTSRAPDWYVPGVTPLCSPVKEKGARLLTAYWIDYECNFYATCWRTTPQNADYSAKDCEQSYTTCGEKIIYDAGWFYSTCSGLGLSKYEVARNIRYWADRARANGTNWRVYTFTDAGGNPYGCRFSVTAL
ncbi:MAG TPA: hypothetical protein VF895_06695 [Gaiellaceae bacterium]